MQPIQLLETILSNHTYQNRFYNLALQNANFTVNDPEIGQIAFRLFRTNNLFGLQRQSPSFAIPVILNVNSHFQIMSFENSHQSNLAIALLAQLIITPQ